MGHLRSITLAKALDRYVNAISLEKKGWMQEYYRANQIKKHSISECILKEISAKDISSYRDERLNTINEKTRKKISGNTVRLELALLSSVFRIAMIEWGCCNTNPVIDVRKPKPGKSRDRRLHASEERKISRYYQEVCNESYIIFHLALETAMRQGELLGLLWENINLQLGVAHLPDTKNGTWRDVPLSRKARELLQSFNPKSSGRVFSFTSNSFKSKWRKTICKLNIKDLHFHDLRHEAISRLFELGTLNVMEVATISGHKSLNMLKRYTHLKAWQLVAKIDSKIKYKKKMASYFVPYPAIARKENDGYRIELLDFESITVFESSKSEAIAKASALLLKALACAAQNGSTVPLPGGLGKITDDILLINPLK
ncbi:tyrosine-type recombinase/integrase [Phytobacter ursingii]